MAAIETGVDTSELKKLIKDVGIGEAVMAFNARETLKAVSFAVEKEIKRRMPVDTGRARASWGHWSGGSLRKHTVKSSSFFGLRKTKTKVANNQDANAGDSVWIDTGLSITQGSNVEYIEYLNNGHSRQAPAGFIDLAAMKGELELQARLGNLDPLDAKRQQAQIDLALAGSKI